MSGCRDGSSEPPTLMVIRPANRCGGLRNAPSSAGTTMHCMLGWQIVDWDTGPVTAAGATDACS